MSELANLVIKRFPENRGLQLVCLRAPSAFHCSRCRRTRRSNLVAVEAEDWDRLLCPACYHEVLSQPRPQTAEEAIPKSWLGAVVSLEDAEKDNVAMGVPFRQQSPEWQDFKAAMQEGDELCEFTCPPDAAEPFGGQAGYALVRGGTVVKYIISVRNG